MVFSSAVIVNKTVHYIIKQQGREGGTGQLKCAGTCAETRFRLAAKRMSSFKSAQASVQSTTGSRGVHISSSNAGYTMFRGTVKGAGYPLDSPVSPSLPLPCITMCHHISTGVYKATLCHYISSAQHACCQTTVMVVHDPHTASGVLIPRFPAVSTWTL